ncbi:type II secretion system GspH family protein [Mameliella sp. CS4]|uniref:type II secretion system protein n=1 Tax=Mameliella sp. CS4 TaxID=2862329 RepID=UPI001C5E74C3|nr:type II secretion system protein [Mameliella sp. CS4]MBW4985853.1 type II secretion system GspH family protein [Mameliella sp. CS4]
MVYSETCRSDSRLNGFSLVELSIVLVILGLLTGGILTGQNLIRAAELRKLTSQIPTYQTAVRTFQDKYFGLPGDLANATRFWETMSSGTCPNATGGNGTETCNGDGNGQINSAGSASQTVELYLFWQHLTNAGLIEGQYTGIAGPEDNDHAVPGENVPITLNNAGFSVEFIGPVTGSAGFPDGDYGNILEVGLPDVGSGTADGTDVPFISAPELWNIDKKLDDGKPHSGFIMTYKHAIRSACVSASAQYNTGSEIKNACNFFVRKIY